MKVTRSGHGAIAGYSGLSTCGSVWSCPVCSAKVASVRAGEVGDAVRAWQALGGDVCMVTLTMRHSAGQSLRHLWDALSYAWSKVTSGRGWVEDKASHNVHGWLRVVEVTHGRHGWHVHVHALMFVRPGLFPASQDTADALAGSLFARWRSALVTRGLSAPIAGRGGCDGRLVAVDSPDTFGDYFAKATYHDDGLDPASRAGWEIAGGARKDGRHGNRTPFGILRDVVRLGDAADLDLWWEYEHASHGKRQMTWSRGLRAQLLTAPELSDQEIAEQDVGGDVEALLPAPTWRAIVSGLADVDVLEAFERGHADGIAEASRYGPVQPPGVRGP